MKRDLLLLVKKYKVPLPSLNKEVLVDEELYDEIAGFLPESVTAPFAFPGFIFRYKKGTALDTDERKVKALEEEYGVPSILWEPPSFDLKDEGVFLEPDYRFARDTLIESLLNQPRSLVSVTRESVLLSIIAEPGWPEYSPITVLTSLFYDVVDAFRVESQAFYPPGKSSMGIAFLRLEKPYPRIREFYAFLKKLFLNRKKKVKVENQKEEKRVDQMDPEELLELFETTGRR